MSGKQIDTPAQYLAALPAERKKALSAVRKTVRSHLPKGYKEVISWGMITYEVPLSVYPNTYNKKPLMYAAIASQKSHMAIYLTCAYADRKTEKAIRSGFKAAGKKLDMGKSCIRFRSLEDIPLDVIGKAIASTPLKDFIAICEKGR